MERLRKRWPRWVSALSKLVRSPASRKPGNPKPRLFRLPRDRALINRAGFNNCGAEQLAKQYQTASPRLCTGG